MPQSDPHHPSLPTATGALARLAAQEARAAGFDLGPLLKTAGLTAAQIDDADERLSAKAQIAFVDAAARAMGRDRLGFELAREFDLRTIGLLYYVAASSETLVEAIQRIERFSAVGNEAVGLPLRQGRGPGDPARLPGRGPPHRPAPGRVLSHHAGALVPLAHWHAAHALKRHDLPCAIRGPGRIRQVLWVPAGGRGRARRGRVSG